MCLELIFGDETVSVKSSFRSNGKVLVQDEDVSSNSNKAHKIQTEIYWDGWVKEEQASAWIERPIWRKAEIFAIKFNQRGRVYDVPPGEVVKGIAFSTDKRTILKVITREAVGKEREVQDRFALTGKRKLVEAKEE